MSLLVCYVICFFFFKQKTAYEMRISDWSSDVCSSDLTLPKPLAQRGQPHTFRRHCFCGNPARHAKADNLMCRQRARAHALLMTAPVDLWCQPRARSLAHE